MHGIRPILRFNMLSNSLVHVRVAVHVDEVDAKGRRVGADGRPFDLGGFGEVDVGVFCGGRLLLGLFC